MDQNFIIEINMQVTRFPSGSDSHSRPSLIFFFFFPALENSEPLD